MKPSRTFTIAMWSITSILLLGLAMLLAIGVVAFKAPDHLGELAGFFQTYSAFALAIAGVGAGGAGAMSHRDAKSGGLTSSQAHQVLAGRRGGEDPGRAAGP